MHAMTCQFDIIILITELVFSMAIRAKHLKARILYVSLDRWITYPAVVRNFQTQYTICNWPTVSCDLPMAATSRVPYS